MFPSIQDVRPTQGRKDKEVKVRGLRVRVTRSRLDFVPYRAGLEGRPVRLRQLYSETVVEPSPVSLTPPAPIRLFIG